MSGVDTLVAVLEDDAGSLTGVLNADKSLKSITVKQKMKFPTQEVIKKLVH